MRLAAIDIGSNSVRLTVVDVPVGGPRTTRSEEKAYTRLGRGTAANGVLDDVAMDETVAALGRMLRIAEGLGVTHTRAVATAAVRDAANGAAFVERIRDTLGLDVEVISGEHEARLAFMSAGANFDLAGRAAVIDIGGGSPEVAIAEDGELVTAASLPLGAVVMSERFAGDDPLPPKRFRKLVSFADEALTGVLGGAVEPVATLVGSGGTITTIGALVAARRGLALPDVQGFAIGAGELRRLVRDLAASTAKQRAAMPGMAESRVDLMVAGAAVVDAAVRALGARELLVNARGMREGIVLEAIERERGAIAPFDRMRGARELSLVFRAGVPHSEQVRHLSLALFDALAAPLGLDPAERPLLEAAALVHDVGYTISHEGHNKHSHHLIVHAGMPGFSPEERRLIAAVARYHRGSLPKARHEEIQGMTDEERAAVSRLAALLRIADGLDRSGGQRVTGLEVEVADAEVVIRIAGDSSLDAEVYGAMRKADLFEAVWGLRVRVVEV